MPTVPILVLWFTCLAVRVWRGTACKIPTEPNRILVVQMAKLGDMICTTPVFHALKQKYPNTCLAVMGNEINQEVLAGNKDVDRYVVFDGLLEGYRTIRRGRFEVVIVTTPDIVSAALAYLALVPCVIVPRVVNGQSIFETFWYRSLCRIAGFIIEDHRMRHYAPTEYLRLLRPIGIQTTDTKKYITFSANAAQKIHTLIPKDDADSTLHVGISPSSGNKLKNWGAERFAQLANDLSRRYSARIVLFGGSRDEKEMSEMKHTLDSSVDIIDLAEQLSVDELKAAISRLDMYVACDTGPIYIAEALNVPTIDILGPVPEEEQAPIGEFHLVVAPPGPREPQMRVMNVHGYDMKEVRRQIESTTVESVMLACATLITRIQKKRHL